MLVCSSGLRAQVPAPAHVVIVIEENHEYSQIIGSPAAPYINALAADSDAALFTQSYALTHPSQPNYLMLFSGSNQGVTTDYVPTGLPFTTGNLGASLIAAGKSFAGYSEDLPSPGDTVATSGAYARKHNPWVNWQDSPTNGIPARDNLPLSSLPANYDSLPAVAFIIPNENNDMHNGYDPSRITTGDTWLHDHLDGYIQWAKSHHSLFVLTFDEGTTTNRIVTLFVGPMVKQGQYAEHIDHYAVLRTIEGFFGLPAAGASATASPITDCWTSAVGVNETDGSVPVESSLSQNYPNPFNPRTEIRYQVSGVSPVRLIVYDLLGREVMTLVNETEKAGVYAVGFDGSSLASGAYFCRLTAGAYVATRKMILMK